MILQPRDLEILSLLQKYGVISSSQISQWFFKNIAKTTVLKRIRLLEKGHYIKRGVTLANGMNVFYLGHQGKKLMHSESFNLGVNRNTIEHDVLLSHIRWKLESLNLGKDITPEFVLRSEVFRNHRYRSAKEQLIPDALMIEQIGNEAQAISIELELTIKSDARYKRIFEQYGSKTSITKIWYFCRDLKSINKIIRMSRKSIFDFRNRLWLSNIDDFIKKDDPELWSVALGSWQKLSVIGLDNFKLSAHAPAHSQSKQKTKKIDNNKSDKSSESGANSLILTSLREGPYIPDHSPSTMESGQEYKVREENKMSELEVVSVSEDVGIEELKKSA